MGRLQGKLLFTLEDDKSHRGAAKDLTDQDSQDLDSNVLVPKSE